MTHEAVFVLIPKENAKDSFDARKLVVLRIWSEIKEFLSPPYPLVGGDFTGLLSDLCGGKPVIPYYNKELRDSVKKNFSGAVQWLNDTIEKQPFKRAMIKAQDIKEKYPELKKYSDSDLFDAFRLELAPMGLYVNLEWTKNELMVYSFTILHTPYVVTPDLREDGRDVSIELGYEDDAMIVNECLSREVIDKMKGKIIKLEDFEDGKGALKLAAKGKLKEVKPEDAIGNDWIVLVDIPEYF